MAEPIDFKRLRPMLLDERPMPYESVGWIWEMKYDGYRVLAMVNGGNVRLQTKSGADCTKWFPEIAIALSSLPDGPHIFDGEVCVLDDIGRTDFDALHERARKRRHYAGAPPVIYAAFDCLQAYGEPMLYHPLLERKARMVTLIGLKRPGLMPVGHFEGSAEELFSKFVIGLGLEGLVTKHVDSFYAPGVRSRDWVKLKRKGAIKAERFSRG